MTTSAVVRKHQPAATHARPADIEREAVKRRGDAVMPSQELKPARDAGGVSGLHASMDEALEGKRRASHGERHPARRYQERPAD